ncbi:Microtubule-Associated Protein Rp/Eb Family Member 1 [Manis pentadactyla]|nr:Microtubule-Associated Protein Rp/Eb Family Member 1 [Manis pentadactyla]
MESTKQENVIAVDTREDAQSKGKSKCRSTATLTAVLGKGLSASGDLVAWLPRALRLQLTKVGEGGTAVSQCLKHSNKANLWDIFLPE